ncbi:MAG: two-component regulator propeller domain-containing protein [Bacteroidota bacterium]
MRTLRVLIAVFLVASQIIAQSIGQWKIYSDLKDVNAAVTVNNTVWAATGGGVFRFNPSDSTYTTYTKADGLSSQGLSAIDVDPSNRIWLGSKEGFINIVDPSDNSIAKIIDIFNSNNTQKQINDIFVKGDTAFVSFDFGLSIISTKTFSFYDSFLKLGSFPAQTRVISAYKSSLIYAVTENGVAVQKPGTTNLSAPESWNNYSFGSNINVQSASRILGFNGQILLATSNGVFTFANNSWQPFILQGVMINDMTVSGNVLYLAGTHDLFQYSNGNVSTVYSNQNLSFSSVDVLSAQTIYVSSTGGLIELKNGKSRLIYPNGPSSNSFVNLSVDPLGQLWVATGKDVTGVGFFKFDGSTWKTYDVQRYPQLPTNSYYNVFAGPDSAVYLCNWGRGITIFKNNSLTTYNKSNSGLVGIPADTNFVVITDAKTDSKGNVWMTNLQSATRKQLSVLTKQNKWYHYSFTNPVLTTLDLLDKLVIDQNNTKWFSVMNGNRGIYYFNENKTFDNLNDDTQGYFSKSDGLISDLISCIAIDHKQNLWIGTNIGVSVITDLNNPKKSLTSSLGIALRNQNVTCIAVDPLDQKWIGTDQGIFILSPDGVQLVDQYNSSNSPLPSNEIKSIAFDPKNGIVYIGTDFGLAELATPSIQPVESFSKLFVYPNPLLLKDGEANSLTIDGLIKNSNIKILSISGNLIRDFKSPGGKVAFWDGRDVDGNLVPSGIYIIIANDDEANNVTTSKVAVIRK